MKYKNEKMKTKNEKKFKKEETTVLMKKIAVEITWDNTDRITTISLMVEEGNAFVFRMRNRNLIPNFLVNFFSDLKSDDDNDDGVSVRFMFISNNSKLKKFLENYHNVQIWNIFKVDELVMPKIVGSCNGLVCISIPERDDFYLYDPVYICNPITGEYINLPKLSREDGQIASGFGYLPKTNEYKVVRVYYSGESQGTFPYVNPCGKVQVYTLGSTGVGGGWRNIKDITFQFNNIPGVAGNGVIYFMDDKKFKVVTFDLSDEEFQEVLEQPPCFDSASRRSFYEVKVLGGYLYVVHHEPGKSVDLWTFQNYNQKKIIIEDNNNNNNNDENNTDHSGSWRKEFSIPWKGQDNSISHEAISLTKSNQVLFWLCGRVFCRYDPKNGTVDEITSIDSDIIGSLQAIPHMNSHVSLKDLGTQAWIPTS